MLKVFLSLTLISIVAANDDPIYDGCGTTKKCLGFPGECLADKDCVTFSSSFVKDGKIIFEMRSWKKAKFIAVGLSTDKEMGEDSVIECVRENDGVRVYSSWTVVDGGDYGAPRDNVPQDIARLVEGQIVDDRIYCQVERDAVTTVHKKTFDLNNKQFFMLMASGTELRDNSVGYHDYAYTSSKKKFNFSV